MTLEPSRIVARAKFTALAESHELEIPLDRCAAWMQAEEQGCEDIADILHQLDTVAQGLFIPQDVNIFGCVARLNHHLFETCGFHGGGDDAFGPEGSMLGVALERKIGLPILLSLIYMEVARRHNMRIDGIGFPTHFLVQPHGADPGFFVDPFHRGRVLRMDQLQTWFNRIARQSDLPVRELHAWLHPLPNRLILVRMNQNLKHAHMRANNLKGALRAVDRTLILMPDSIDVRRDRGLLRTELGLEEEGSKDLDAYLAAQKQPSVVSALPLDE